MPGAQIIVIVLQLSESTPLPIRQICSQIGSWRDVEPKTKKAAGIAPGGQRAITWLAC
jgi:hypothetical protein